ncbi:MAG: hypothetical protein R2940_01670 [Syntrophotaleaceae bacterium]
MHRFLLIGLFFLFLAGCGSGSGSNTDPQTEMAWENPVLFSALHEGFQGARLVVDTSERAMLAWSKDSHIWAATSADGDVWNTPEQVDDATMRAGLTALSINASGAAALMWRAEESTGDYFKARLYSPATGWDATSQLLDGLTVDGTGGDIAMNDAGDVMGVFTRYSASGHVWARSYTDTSDWSPAAIRLDTLPGFSNHPEVALDGDGNAIVVWEQWDGSRNQALARSYTAIGVWDISPTELDGAGDPSIEKIHIDLGTNGDGLAHWTLADRTAVKVRRLISGSWQATETVATGTNIYTSDAMIAPDGRIVQTWADGQNVYAKTWVGGVWEADSTLVSDDGEALNLRSQVMAMDRTNGRVVVMWTRLALADADGSAVWARRYDPVDGWSPVEQVLPWTPGILFDVDDAVLFDDGRILAVLAGEDASVYEYSTYLIHYR